MTILFRVRHYVEIEANRPGKGWSIPIRSDTYNLQIMADPEIVLDERFEELILRPQVRDSLEAFDRVAISWLPQAMRWLLKSWGLSLIEQETEARELREKPIFIE